MTREPWQRLGVWVGTLLAVVVAAGCGSATRWEGDAEGDSAADADADVDADADADGDVDGDGDGDVTDADLRCPAPVGEDSRQVTSPMITTDPASFVDEEVVVVGTLMAERARLCDDLGPCGTCYPGLTLDGVIRLRGPGPSDELCDETIGCVERVDSCLPRWECWPFEIGRRVRTRGTWRQGPDTSPMVDEWDRLLQSWFLELDAIEPVAPVAGAGLFAGTLQVESIQGGGCSTFPSSVDIEVVVATSSVGSVAELMSPDGESPLPVWAGWHVGPLTDATLLLAPPSGLGNVSLWPTSSGYAGEYSFSLSGPDCQVSSLLELSQVH